MSEMVERVARAMADFKIHGGWDGIVCKSLYDEFRAEARVAIEAMREPTAAMERAPRAAGVMAGDYPMCSGEASEAWRYMIESALATSS